VSLLVWRPAVGEAPPGGKPRNRENGEDRRPAVERHRQAAWSISPSGSWIGARRECSGRGPLQMVLHGRFLSSFLVAWSGIYWIGYERGGS